MKPPEVERAVSATHQEGSFRQVHLLCHSLHPGGVGRFGQQADGGGVAAERLARERIDLSYRQHLGPFCFCFFRSFRRRTTSGCAVPEMRHPSRLQVAGSVADPVAHQCYISFLNCDLQGLPHDPNDRSTITMQKRSDPLETWRFLAPAGALGLHLPGRLLPSKSSLAGRPATVLRFGSTVVNGDKNLGAQHARVTCCSSRIDIAHKGLLAFFERGDARRIPPAMAPRIRRILSDLDAAVQPADMNLPGYRLHPLAGDRRGQWSVRVSRNWRVVFRFRDGEAVDVTLIDYR